MNCEKSIAKSINGGGYSVVCGLISLQANKQTNTERQGGLNVRPTKYTDIYSWIRMHSTLGMIEKISHPVNNVKG